MKDNFQALLNSDDFEKRAELEKDFLQKTVDALCSRKQESALEVAAQFDRFKKQTADNGEEFYSDFFEVLSHLIKRKYLDREKDFGRLDLSEF